MLNKVVSKLLKWWRIYRVNTLGVIGLVTFIIIVTLITIGPTIATHGPRDTDYSAGWQGGNIYWGPNNWMPSGSVSITSEGEPYVADGDISEHGEYHVRFISDNGYIKRMVDLSDPRELEPHLQFYAKAVSFENGDTARCLISPTGDEPWTPVQTWVNGDDDGDYSLYDIDLSAYPNWKSKTFWIAFEADMTSPDARFYLDTVKVAFSSTKLAPSSPIDDFEPYVQSWQPPSRAHLLGTNNTGQDIFSKLLYSGQISLLLGVLAASLTATIGTVIGLISGYYGGIVDEIINRICDVIMTLPGLPLMLIMAVVLGPGFWTILFVIVITGWARPVRRMRVMILSMKTAPYVDAAKSMGASTWRIIFRHMLPNVGGLFAAAITLGITGVIMLEAALSFLGFGDPGGESLGMMLHTAQSTGAWTRHAWWCWVPPGMLLTLIGLSCIFIGNAINERFVLRLRRRRGMV